MCGITGVYKPNGSQPLAEIIDEMTRIISHRGPDDQGLYVDSGIGLGMRRLSVIDVAGGHQPIFTPDRQQVIVFNGEIYNFQALRHELEQRGHQFRTRSDTEVVLHLYVEYGLAGLQKLRGMFAFAIWDTQSAQLLLVRDRVGIKPLYYSEHDGALIFASEIKSMLQHPGTPRQINLAALNAYLSLQYVPGPETMFDGISKLPPGHYLLASAEGVTIAPYWQWPERVSTTARSEADLAEELLALLRESVKLRLISDVPLGAFLSGGVDSSTIVALMSEFMAEPVKTFSVGFAGDTAYNETDYARQVANLLGADHHELVLDADGMALLPQLVWHFDEPLADRAALPTFLVSQLARRSVTVALTGEGGDELFAGYRRYLAVGLAQRYRVVPGALRRGIGRLLNSVGNGSTWSKRYARLSDPDLFDIYMGQQTNFAPAAKRALLAPEVQAQFDLEAPFSGWGPLSREDWLNTLLHRDATTWLPDDLLMKADKMSMATSLEARVPFLDHRLIEFVSTIPVGYHLRHMTTKYLFKRAVRGLIPDEIIKRRKQGFDVPLTRWLRSNGAFVRDLLLSSEAQGRGYFNHAFIETLVTRATSTTNATPEVGGQVWSLLCLELWHRLYLDGDRSWLSLKGTDEYLDRQQILLH